MNKLTDKKEIRAMFLLLTTTYMASYMTRINFGAVISEIVAQTGMEKSVLVSVVTGSTITYGVGQLISGYVGDRVSPKLLVLSGLLVASAMNFLMFFASGRIMMTVIWCINGMAQAFMWPPLAKLMADMFSDSDYKKASTMVNWGSSFGTIAIYLLAPLMILLSGWRSLFIVTSLAGITMAIVWQKFCREPVESRQQEEVVQETASGNKDGLGAVLPVVALVMLGIVLQGSLRDGVTTWMPSYISETYHLGSEISILTGVALPIFSIVSMHLARKLYEKIPDNPIRCAAYIFGVGALSALLLTFVSGSSPVGSVLGAALLTGSMYGVNLMLVTMVPPFFRKYGAISTISGVLNSCTYVGSALATYGFALLSDRMGWGKTVFVWFIIAFLGMVVCAFCSRVWKKKM